MTRKASTLVQAATLGKQESRLCTFSHDTGIDFSLVFLLLSRAIAN